MKSTNFDRIVAGIHYVLVGALLTFNYLAYTQEPPVVPENNAELRALFEIEWREQFNTWGRWGDGDNKGASNLITPEKVLSANALVQEGIVVSLAAPVPQVAASDVGENGVFHRSTDRITDRNTFDNCIVDRLIFAELFCRVN